ncbi:CD59 glycoprotein-like [Stigmatopora argus]
MPDKAALLPTIFSLCETASESAPAHGWGWDTRTHGHIAADEDVMTPCGRGVALLAFLMLTFAPPGDALRCYKCSDYTGRCDRVQECTYEDACLTLGVRGGETLRQCIRFTDCDNSRLSQLFPWAAPAFWYRCCNNNLCNNSGAGSRSPSPWTLLAGPLAACLLAVCLARP